MSVIPPYSWKIKKETKKLGPCSEVRETRVGIARKWQRIRPFHMEYEAIVNGTNMYCKRGHEGKLCLENPGVGFKPDGVGNWTDLGGTVHSRQPISRSENRIHTFPPPPPEVLATVIRLYIISPVLTYVITGSLYLWTTFCHSPSPATGNQKSDLFFYEIFGFFRVHTSVKSCSVCPSLI